MKKVPRKKVKKYFELIKLLETSNPKKKEVILNHLDNNSIHFICELVHNVIHNNFQLNNKKINKLKTVLKPMKNCCRYLSKKSGKIERKRKLMVQHGKGLGLILSTAIPILLSLITQYTKSK
jgi:hypothetical protein